MAVQDSVQIEAGMRTENRTYPQSWIKSFQLTWVLVATLTVSLFFAALPWQFGRLARNIDLRSLAELNLSPQVYAAYVLSLNLAVILFHVVIASLIFVRRPRDWMALFVSLALITNGAMVPLSGVGVPRGISAPFWDFLINVVIFVGLVSSVGLLFLFPDGRFVPRWTWAITLGWAVLILSKLFFSGSPFSLTRWPVIVQGLVYLLVASAGVFSQAYRFSYLSTPTERQQIKWASLGLVAAILGPLVYFLASGGPTSGLEPLIPNLLYQRVGGALFAFSLATRLAGQLFISLALFLFPLSFAIAILRYRLWDIDILIRRTLIYSILTGLLLVIYLSSVLLMQALFTALTGQRNSEIVTVLSTLAIAALFIPLRDRIQAGIDRRFYRHKYNAELTLSAFAAGLRDELDLDQLSERLVSVVEETMQPVHVSLWLAKERGKRESRAIDFARQIVSREPANSPK